MQLGAVAWLVVFDVVLLGAPILWLFRPGPPVIPVLVLPPMLVLPTPAPGASNMPPGVSVPVPVLAPEEAPPLAPEDAPPLAPPPAPSTTKASATTLGVRRANRGEAR